MSQLTIESLPKEMVLEIFNHLDAESLKLSFQISKRFNTLLSNDLQTMRKLPLYISSKSANQSELEKLTRQYHTINFEDITITQTLFKKLKRSNILRNIRKLVIHESSVAADAFRMILKSCSAVEKILILSSSINAPKSTDMVDVKTLKSLIVMESSFDYFGFFGETKIKELKVHDQSHLLKKPEDFEKFLKRTKTLESLALRVMSGEIFKCFKNREQKGFQFQLKKLSITYGGFGGGTENDDNFVDILKNHKETLESMEIESKLHEDTYEFILTYLKLKALKMDCRWLPSTSIFYSPIVPNIYLQELVVTKEFSHQNAISGIFRIYKNIQNLVVTGWQTNTQNDILVAAAHLQQLNTLSIPEIPENPPELPIPSLQYLQIEKYGTVVQFQAYVVHHQNIKTLSIKWIDGELSNNVLNAVTLRLPLLEQVIFGPYFALSRLAYDTFKQNCPKLQAITMFKFCDDENLFSPPESNPQIRYFTNNSPIKFFKREKSMWHEEDWNYHFHKQADDNEYEDDDDSYNSDDDFFDDDSDFEDNFLLYGDYYDEEGLDHDEYEDVMQNVFFIN